MDKEVIISILLGIGLSASTGFRIFIPMLVASIAGHFEFLNFGNGFEWLSSTPAMISFGVAAIVEVAAYYIPIVDNFLDAIATPLAIGAGALLSVSVLPIDNDMNKWIMGIIIGGGSAGAIQSGTAITRLFSSKATLTAGNPIVATGENAGATLGSILSLFFPIIIGSGFLILIVYSLYKVAKWRKRKKANSYSNIE